MSTETVTRTTTADTAEPVTAQALPADDWAGDGYDWMGTLEATAWSVLPNWGSEGWDAGSWPYIEGDSATHWFRCQDACFEAITAEVFFHWASGQSDGPDSRGMHRFLN